MRRKKNPVKALPKSMRERKRYVLFSVEPWAESSESNSRKSPDGKSLWTAIEAVLLSLYGSIGSAEINASMVKFYPAKKMGIIQCSRGSEPRVRAALLFVSSVNGQRVKVRSRRVSGSIKALAEKSGLK